MIAPGTYHGKIAKVEPMQDAVEAKVKVCVGCEQEQGEPHKDWCPVVTGTLSSIPGGDPRGKV